MFDGQFFPGQKIQFEGGWVKPPGNGNDAFTKLLLHCDGSDASTTFTDSSASAHTVSAQGNAQVDTAESKFGGASLLCDGSGDWLSIADSADWNMGSGDFTVDAWFNRNGGNGTDRAIIFRGGNTAGTSSFGLNLNTSNVMRGVVYSSGPTITTVTGTTAFTSTGWHHVALVRTGNTLKLFIDGTQEGGDVSANVTLNSPAVALGVGRLSNNTGFSWNGWIDEVRVSKGVARWTANFTPPTTAYS